MFWNCLLSVFRDEISTWSIFFFFQVYVAYNVFWIFMLMNIQITNFQKNSHDTNNIIEVLFFVKITIWKRHFDIDVETIDFRLIDKWQNDFCFDVNSIFKVVISIDIANKIDIKQYDFINNVWYDVVNDNWFRCKLLLKICDRQRSEVSRRKR